MWINISIILAATYNVNACKKAYNSIIAYVRGCNFEENEFIDPNRHHDYYGCRGWIAFRRKRRLFKHHRDLVPTSDSNVHCVVGNGTDY